MLSGCGTVTPRESPAPVARAPDAAAPAPAKPAAPRGGGYYLDDGPGDSPPPDLDRVPDAVPKPEPLRRGTMRPYTVMGQYYTPMTQLAPYQARGIASWYGRRYHGQQTASGEIYDMYGMTAAHTTLPIPSYARVTNLANNKSVVVRINDRGPFHSERLIDLSYTAAYRLGVLGSGKALVEVETIIPGAGTPASSEQGSRLRDAIVRESGAAPSRAGVASVSGVTSPKGARRRAEEGPLWGSDPEDARRAGVDAPMASPTVASPQVGPLLHVPPAPVPPSDGAPREEPALSAVPPQEPVATQTEAAITGEPKGVFLQLGAFGSQDNADSYLARVRAQIEWLAPALRVYPRDGLFRVHAGPYANQAEARAAADSIGQALGFKPMVLVR